MQSQISGIINTITDSNKMKKYIENENVLSYSSNFVMMFITYIKYLHLPDYNNAYIDIMLSLCNDELLSFYSNYDNIYYDNGEIENCEFGFYGIIILLTCMIRKYDNLHCDKTNNLFLYKMIYNSLPNELRKDKYKKLIFDGILKTLSNTCVKNL